MTLKFQPKEGVKPRYALYTEDRYGNPVHYRAFKTSNNLGVLKGLVSRGMHYDGSDTKTYHSHKILEFIDGDWYVLYDVPAGLTYKELPWIREVQGWSYSFGSRTRVRAVPMSPEDYLKFRLLVLLEKFDESDDLYDVIEDLRLALR